MILKRSFLRDWRRLAALIALPLAVGGVGALLSGGFDRYAALEQPPLSPPAWVFPVVWSLLYVGMGAASFLISRTKESEQRGRALLLYAVSLALNLFWPLLFFRLGAFLPALFELLLLWCVVLGVIGRFSRLSSPAAWLLVPYLVWLAFAAYLNFGVWFLNG